MPSSQTIQFLNSHELTTLPPLSLYVHLPWCVQKCPYCDFNSHAASTKGLPEDNYVAALLSDLESELPYIWGRPVTSIFFGGGTPSLFSANAINQLLNGIRARVRLHPDAEITLEANPGTFEQEKFLGFKEAGINRLSIGVQSFDDQALKVLGRIHNSSDAKKAIALAIETFERVNVDLMYALPNQSVTQAAADIQTAIDFGVQHISAYHLTMEPNTVFGHTPPPNLPNDDQAIDIEEAVHQALINVGFEHYETSAFAKDKKYCQHNLNYWQFGDYIGIGAGAHGKISQASGIERTTRIKHPNEYLKHINESLPLGTRKVIAKEDLPFEFMMNALRLTQGVPAAFFTERTGLPIHQISPILQKAKSMGLMEADPTRLAPSLLGQHFLNDLITLFLQEHTHE